MNQLPRNHLVVFAVSDSFILLNTAELTYELCTAETAPTKIAAWLSQVIQEDHVVHFIPLTTVISDKHFPENLLRRSVLIAKSLPIPSISSITWDLALPGYTRVRIRYHSSSPTIRFS